MSLVSVMLVAFRHELHQRHARLKLNPVDRRHRPPPVGMLLNHWNGRELSD